LEISSDDVFIIGDLNNDMLDTVDNCLKNFCNNNGLVNTITKGTRTNPTTKLLTLLDVILCLCNKYLIKSEVFHMPCSDHGLIMSVFNHSSSFNKPTQINSRCLNDKKILSLKTILLSTLSLSNFDRYITVESRWAAIKALLISCINIAAPIKNMQVKTKNLVPWFDKDLVILSKKRNRLYNKAISSKLDNDWLNFKNIRQSFSHLFRLKKSTFYKNIVGNESTSSSKLWRKLDPYLNPNKITKVSPSLIINDTYFNTPKDIAMTFSNFFSSVTNSFFSWY